MSTTERTIRSRSADRYTLCIQYDVLGRQVSHGTPQGQFSYAYLGETGQASRQ
ncbi:hypothetical protein ACQUKI_23845 [Ralstonia pseudosolanacearum]